MRGRERLCPAGSDPMPGIGGPSWTVQGSGLMSFLERIAVGHVISNKNTVNKKYTPLGGRKWSALLFSSGWLRASLLLEPFPWSIFPSRSWWRAVTKVPISLGGHNITDIPRRWGSNSILIPGDLKKWPYSPPHWKMRTPLP